MVSLALQKNMVVYSVEYKAFVSCASKIISTIRGDLSIANRLLEAGLISDETYEEVSVSHTMTERKKAEKIFGRIKDKIKSAEGKFHVFCSILAKSVYYKDLFKNLKGIVINSIRDAKL